MANPEQPNKSPEATEQKDSPQPRTEFGFPETTLPTYYINNAQFVSSEMEMRIDLGEIQHTNVADDGVPTTFVTPQVRVYMSWPFALRFYRVLRQQIKNQKTNVDAVLAELQKQGKKEFPSPEEEE